MAVLKHQLRLLFVALQFYTRLPTPSWVGWQPEWLTSSARYFSVVGAIVGSISAAVWWLSMQMLPASVAATLAVIAAVLATGAFHEDGLADACDGFGAGGAVDRILMIMKDSRVGAYGAIGIGLALLLRVQLLASWPAWLGAVVLICGHTVSRTVAIALVLRHPYVGHSDASAATASVNHATNGEHSSSKAKPAVMGLALCDVVLCAVWAFIVCGGLIGLAGLATDWRVFLLGTLAASFVAWRAGALFQARIGGITGDCLGAVQQVSECVFTATCLAAYTALYSR